MYSSFTRNKKHKHREIARTYAIQCLYAWYTSGNSINSVIKYFLETKNTKKFNVTFFYKITLGIVLHKTKINKFFLLHKKDPISSYTIIEILIIKICIFELFYKEKNKNYKAQNLYNTVQLLHKFCGVTCINFLYKLTHNVNMVYNLKGN
jgi:transcription termination factor NusB